MLRTNNVLSKNDKKNSNVTTIKLFTQEEQELSLLPVYGPIKHGGKKTSHVPKLHGRDDHISIIFIIRGYHCQPLLWHVITSTFISLYYAQKKKAQYKDVYSPFKSYSSFFLFS